MVTNHWDWMSLYLHGPSSARCSITSLACNKRIWTIICISAIIQSPPRPTGWSTSQCQSLEEFMDHKSDCKSVPLVRRRKCFSHSKLWWYPPYSYHSRYHSPLLKWSSPQYCWHMRFEGSIGPREKFTRLRRILLLLGNITDIHFLPQNEFNRCFVDGSSFPDLYLGVSKIRNTVRLRAEVQFHTWVLISSTRKWISATRVCELASRET